MQANNGSIIATVIICAVLLGAFAYMIVPEVPEMPTMPVVPTAAEVAALIVIQLMDMMDNGMLIIML